jgi:hypothetical protein
VSAPTDRPRSPYLLLRPGPSAALPVAGIALTGWALRSLYWTGTVFFAVFMSGYALVAVMKVVWRGDDDKAVVQALVSHTDPGPDLRERAAAWARGAQHVRPSDRWGPRLIAVGLAVACIVVALTRPSWPVALPAPFLLAWGGAVEAARRTSAARGARWLDDPPVPADDRA